MSEAKCRHCGRPKVNRPRGLCWTCYHMPGVKEQYPAAQKNSWNAGEAGCVEPVLMPSPTQALPGTAEKIEVMKRRMEAGEKLFHPDDSLEEQEGRHARSNSQGGRIYRYWGWHHSDGGED